MFLAKKIRLIPTKEQEILFWKSAGTARWAYNYFLAENQRVYNEEKRYLSGNELRKYINNTLKKTTHTWLSEVSSNVMKHGVMDAEKALKNYFKGIGNKPKFKNKHKSIPSFYVNYESLVAKNGGFHGERIGYVKTSEPLPKINDKHYVDPRITYDGKYWYLSIGYKVEPIKQQLTDEVIGIDLGIKDLAICSNGKKYQNINKLSQSSGVYLSNQNNKHPEISSVNNTQNNVSFQAIAYKTNATIRTSLTTKDEKKKYEELSNELNLDYRKKLEFALKSGLLLKNNSNVI